MMLSKADIEECTTKTNNSKIKLSDPNSASCTFLNDDKISVNKIKIDDCVFTKGGEEKRCDWMLHYTKTKEKVILIELKKSGNRAKIKNALEQIENTHKKLKDLYKKADFIAYIVSRKSPTYGRTKDNLLKHSSKKNPSFELKSIRNKATPKLP